MFVFTRPSLAVLALTSIVSGCDTSNPCARIRCDSPRQCNPTNGTCELPAGYDGGQTTPDAGLDCPASCTGSMVCNRATGTCVQCLSPAQCACPTPLCVGNVCVADPADSGVIAAADDCARAVTAVACDPKTFDVDVNLATLGNELQTICAAPDAGGNDAVFNLYLGRPLDVRVTVSPGGGNAVPVAALRTSCTTNVDLACVDSQGASGSFRVHRLQPGAYSFVLQGYDRSGSGPTRARVEVLPPTGSTNETCLQAAPLSVDGGTTRVDLPDAEDDVTLPCNATARSPDLFYRFTLSQPSDVVIDAIGTAPQQPVMALWRGGCRTPTSVACTASSSSVGRMIARRLDAGEYTVVVESQGAATMGRIELTTTVSSASVPPSNDSCTLPKELTFNGNEATAIVDTSLGTDDSAAMCGGMGGPDLVYRLVVPTPAIYTFTATPDLGSGGVPVISLRNGNCLAAMAEQCSAAPGLNQPATFMASLTAGTYYLWLDSTTAATAGRVTLTVRK